MSAAYNAHSRYLAALAEAEAAKAEYFQSLAHPVQPVHQLPAYPGYPYPPAALPQPVPRYEAHNYPYSYPPPVSSSRRLEDQELFEAFTAFRMKEQAKAELKAAEETRLKAEREAERVRQLELERDEREQQRQRFLLAQQQKAHAEREAAMDFIARMASQNRPRPVFERAAPPQSNCVEEEPREAFLHQLRHQEQPRRPTEVARFLGNLNGRQEQPAQQTAPTSDETDVLQSFLGQLFGVSQEPQKETKQETTSSQVDPLNEILRALTGQTVSAPRPVQQKIPVTAPAPAQATPSRRVQFLQNLVQASRQAHEQTNPTTPSKLTPAPQTKPTSEGQSMLEQLLVGVHDVIAKGSQTLHPAAPTTTAPTNSAPQSLMEQLQTRLYSDTDAEIRDTAQAIMESLKTVGLSTPSETTPGASTSSKPSSSPTRSDENAESASSKGKGKESATPVSHSEPLPLSHSDSFDAISAVENTFSILTSEFVFPPHLDFELTNANNTRPPSPSSALAKLSYTSQNAPVRYYDKALNALLTELDSVDSMGSETVRARRKEVVGRVEEALEALEGEIEGRWRAAERKLVKANEPFALDKPIVLATLEPAVDSQDAVTQGNVVAESAVTPYEVDLPEISDAPVGEQIPEASEPVAESVDDSVETVLPAYLSKFETDTNFSSDTISTPSTESVDDSTIATLVPPLEPDAFLLSDSDAHTVIKDLHRPVVEDSADAGSDWSDLSEADA